MGKQAQLSLSLAAVTLVAVLPAQDAPANAKARGSNALDVYIMAIDEARRVFKVKSPQMLNLPYEATQEGYKSGYWVGKCNESTVARTLFAQAARTKTCNFGLLPSGGSQLQTISPVLWQLRTLVFAHGMQNAQKSPISALHDAETLLHHARQLFGGSSTDALALGYVAEANAITLIDKSYAATRDPAAIQRLRRSLEQHRKLRVTRDQIADAAFAETLHRLKVIPGIINSKESRQRVIDRLNRVLLVVRDPESEKLTYMDRTPSQAASKWSNELIKIKRPQATSAKLREAFKQSLKLPAVAGIESLLNRHTMGQKQLDELLRKLPK